MTHPLRTSMPRSLLALLVGGVVMSATRFVAGVATPVEVVFDATARLLGVPWVFNALHAAPFGVDRYAKFVLFGVVMLGLLAVAWWATRRFAAWRERFGRVTSVAGVTLFAIIGLGLVLLPAMGLGVFGTAEANRAWAPVPLHGAMALAVAVWAFVASGASRSRVVPAERRRVVTALGVGLATLPLGLAAMWRSSLALAQDLRQGLFDAIQGLSPRITPVGEHYVISKNVFSPRVNARSWRLELAGAVDRPQAIDRDALRSLPSVTRPTTLMCISNPVGGDLIGTSEWTGVRLADLLDLAEVQEGAFEVVLFGADNYTESFPLDAAYREGTIVAYAMDGEPIPREHGFPARVLVPGIYGMKNVKWVERIEVRREAYRGYWQARGWSEEAIVKTMSRIDTDVATDLGDGRWAVAGIAFAGLRGVSMVQVSIDAGVTWIDAVLEAAPNAWSWRRWAAILDATDSVASVGRSFEVRVRAVDGDGTIQTDVVAPPLPDGASGHHRVATRIPSA